MNRFSMRQQAGMAWVVLVWLALPCLLLANAPALAAQAAPPLAVTLEGLQRVEDPGCGAGRIRLEGLYRVTGADPVELLIERAEANGEKSLEPIRQVDSEGRVVDSRCVTRQHAERAEVRMRSVLGAESTPLQINSTPNEKTLAVAPTERIPVNRATRHQQFGNEKRPEKRGTCCWHYVYITYPWQREEPVTEITIPVTLEPFPLDGGRLYLQLHSAINGISFYFGLQTELRLHDKRHGPGAIFSRWDSQDARDLKTAPGGFSEIGAYEGRFVSVRKPFAPGAGELTLRLRARPDSDQEHVWLELGVMRSKREGAHEVIEVGALRFPGNIARLTKRLKVAVESYDLKEPSITSTWRVPCFVWSLQPPRVDGVQVSSPPRIDYPDGAPRIIRAMPMDQGGVQARRIGWSWNGREARACEATAAR
ncbi:MAG: hypothetical protein HQM01_15905 [Magnetococcales bacterium]|nr:hypothetical protein [Magnetococcales bacterium]